MSKARKALIVGSRLGGPQLLRCLGQLGYAHTVTQHLEQATEVLRGSRFDLILAQLRLDDGSGSSLIGPAIKSGGDLFLCMAVSEGCLWLPAVQNRHDCWGAPALRPVEFKRLLTHEESHAPSEESEVDSPFQMAATG